MQDLRTLLGILCLAVPALACGSSDEGNTPPGQLPPGLVGGACDGKPVNDCGGCADLGANKPGLACGEDQYFACQGGDKTACLRADGPPITGLVASTDKDDRVQVSWLAPTAKAAAGYQIYRDGILLGGTLVTTYLDRTAEPGAITAPKDLVASDGLHKDKVALSWTAGSVSSGKVHRYAVRAMYNQGAAQVPGLSAPEVPGNRGAPAIDYQFSRDNGAWTSVGDKTKFDDVNAPKAQLKGLEDVRGEARNPAGVALLRLTGQASVEIPAPSTYRLRLVAGGESAEAPKADTGYRLAGTAIGEVQWQRSANDSDANYTDVPGMTGATWYDTQGPSNGAPRYYRAKVVFDGGEVFSKATRVTGVYALSQVALFQDHGCAVRTNGGLQCWGADGANRVAGAPTTGSYEKVVVGSLHGCAIKSGGTVTCWGLTGGDNRTVVPAGLASVVDLAATSAANCALSANGALTCWGNTSAGQLTPPAGTYKKVYGNMNQTFCAIRTDNTPRCWGGNPAATLLTQVPLVVPMTQLAVSIDSACGIDENSRLRCWGNNPDGRAPPGPSVDLYKEVSRGWESNCALRLDGTVECFGPSVEGAFVGRSATTFKTLATGYHMVCGLGETGRFSCLQSRPYSNVANLLPSPLKYRSLSVAQGDVMCAIRDDGRRECWGYDPNSAPKVSNRTYKQLELDESFGCGIRDDDQIECWGSLPSEMQPNYPGAYVDFSLAYRGSNNTGLVMCAITKSDGWIECFGSNPPEATIKEKFKSVAAGRRSVCGVRDADGSIVCRGDDQQGSVSQAPSSGGFKNVVRSRRGAGYCALKEDGRRLCWGRVEHPTPNPRALTTTAYARTVTSRDTVCGVRQEDGRRECNGGTAPGLSLDSFVELALSRDGQACGIRTDGRLFCWTPTYGAPRFD